MNVDKYVQKKIVKYIEKDHYGKLKRFLKEEEIKVDEIITKRGEKMLHLAAKEGASDCLEYLLDKGANAKLVDKKGNLPLHRALEYVIDEYSRDNERDLVNSLLTYSSGLMNVRNTKGFTPKELILNLEKVKSKKIGNSVQNCTSFANFEKQKERTEDDEWRDKLAEECDYEYETNLGKFEDAQNYVGESAETYDDWADRIYKAFASSRKRKYPQTEEKPKKLKSLKPDIDLEQAAKNYQLLKDNKVKLKQKRMCDKLFNSDEIITENDIPFENFEATKILDILLGDVAGGNAEDVKKTIREAIRRWHPDKFKQKLGERICEKDSELVMEKVKHISQALTN
eukprot:GFUD01016908.1.p1 GENE.GFUD01016908.1~~GFUD01016908.1.p1  ORF type:complete len:341 (+),score=110.32 GFUD01016908.1:50-1072(+)